MADEKDVAVVETSMANPKQAVNVLENIDKVSAGTTPVATLQNNAPLFKQEENNNFMNSDAWNDYMVDTFRAYNSKRYPGFAAIETTAANPAYSTIINRYGKAVADRAQAIHSTYAKANNWFGRVADAYDAQRYGLRSAAARKDLSDAIRGGDEAEIARAKMRYQSEQRKSYEEGVPFDEYGNTLMSLLASTARNPETIPIEIGGALFAPYTGGLSEVAARAINAAIVGADTYRLETGSALESLDKETEGLSEEQKFNAARPAGAINAAVEAGLFGLGGNIAGRGLKGIGTEVAVRSTQRAVKKKTGEEISYEAAKELVKTDFLKALQKPAAEKTFKNTVAEFAANTAKGAPVEGWQEVFQDSVTEAMLHSVKNGTTLTEELLDDWADFALDPFSEKHADKWETFINVSLASLVMGGGYSAAGAGVRKVGGMVVGDTKHNGTGTIQDKALGAYNNTLGLSKLFSWHKNGDSKNAVGASNAVLEEQIKRGEVSGKLYTTAEQVQEMQQDPEIAAALEAMGVATSMSESAENGGVVEIDLLAYDKVVNESQNTTLFQKMRNYLSFSDTTMSLNEFNQFINSKGKELASLITDEVRNDQESVYNKLKNMAIKAGRTAERAEGYAVMGHVLLNNLQALTKGEKNDILDRLTLTVDQGNGQILSENFGTKQKYKGQQIQYKGKQVNAYNDVFTKDGTQIKYAEYNSDYNTGINREAIKDDTNIRVVKMSPQQFLNMTPKKMGDRDTTDLENAIKNGNEIAMPFLDVVVADAANKILKIVGHEGRHRSLAMQNLGVQNGYVILNSKDFYRQPSLFADGLKGWKLLSQGETNIDNAIELQGDARDVSADLDIGGFVDAVFTEKGEFLFDRIMRNSVQDKDGEHRVHINPTPRELQGILNIEGSQRLLISKKTGNWYFANSLNSIHKDMLQTLIDNEYETGNKEDALNSDLFDAYMIDNGSEQKYEGNYFIYGTKANISWFMGNPWEMDKIKKNYDDVISKYPKLERYLGQFDEKKNATLLVKRLDDEISRQESMIKSFHADTERRDYLVEHKKTLMDKYGITQQQVDNFYNDQQQPRVYHMFVGSRNADIANDVADTLGKRKELDEARAMEKAAIDKGEMPDYEAIWEKTGWYKEPDTSWSYEIADNEANIDKATFFKNGKARTGVHTTLGQAIKHDKLFDLFPALKDIAFHIGKSNTSGKQNSGNSIALYHSNNGKGQPEIIINASRIARHIKDEDINEQILSSVLHELQHEIDDKMSMMYYPQYRGDKEIKHGTFTKEEQGKIDELNNLSYKVYDIAKKYNIPVDNGANRKLFAKRNELLTAAQTEEEKQTVKDYVDKYIETQDYNIRYDEGYYRTSTEVHARNTQHRIRMTEEQRKQVSPSATLDIAGKVQVGRSVTADELYKNTRVLRVMKFAGVPVSTQQQGQVEAGRTTAQAGQYEIALTPDANVVTFAHELFHVFSLELQRVYNNGTITDYWKKQADKMFKIAGAEPQVDPADPTVVRYFLTEAQEEHLANMFTTYIMKGKIENQEVRGLLSKLIDLFKDTYLQLMDSGLVEQALDKKAYSFFNSVVSTQDAIEEIQRNAGLLEILPPEGVDRELYDYYIANLAVSKVEASNDLRRKLFKIEEFKNSPEYTKMMQKFKDEAKAELLEDDKYKVLAQASLYTEDKAQQTLLWAEKNIPEANFTLGDITDILENTPSLEEASTRAAEEEMDKYIAKEYKLTPQEIGFKEERNRAKVRALLAEAVMQRGGTIADVEEEIRKAEAASDKHLGKISVYQIMDLKKWKDREAAAVQRYTWARSEGRKDLMSAERYNQAVLNLIMIKSAGFKNEYQKLTSLFEKLQTKQKKYQRKDEHGNKFGPYEHRYHAQDWELLRSISENFGNKIRDGRRSMKPVHQQMKEWIQTQVENRFTTVAGLEDFIPFIDKGTDGSIGAMKGKDFKKLWAVVHTIDSIAMREQQLYLDGQYEEMNKYIQQTLQFHNEKGIKTDKDKEGWYNKFFGRYGTWQNPEPLLRAIFPPEVFQKIFLPMFNGALKSEAQAKIWIDKWRNAKAKINTSNEAFVLDDGTQITYGETNKKTLTYGDVANLLIAMGAEHSYENYKLKFGLSDEQAEQIASQAIKRNKAYVEFMNTTWKVYGEATEALNKSFQERTNELFVRKEHRAFTIDGVKFEGGYVPEDKHYLALVRELGTWNQGTHNKVENKNEKLITKVADGDILSIIDITETKLSQSAKWAYAAIPYNNIKKFIEDKQIEDTIGERAFSFIRDWLQNWDTPHVDESGVWRPLTRVTTIAALGMRASTALLQVSGLAQAMAHLGPTYLARGILQFVREGGFFHPFKGPRDKSLYMATRVEDPFAARFGTESQGRSFREIFESYNAKSKLGKVGVGLLSAYQTLAMMGIQIIDGWVATITWNGAYRRALDQGMTKAEAELEADSAVRITQSDATQISRSSAMQEPWARSVTAFATWTMAMRSQVVALSSSKSYRKDMVMWLATYAVMSSFIEAFLKEMTEPADEGEEDKEMLERIMNSWYNKIVEAVGTQVMPFAGAGAAGAKMLAGALVNTDDEKIFKVFAGGSVPALQYASRAVQAGAQSIKYMRSGEEEDRDKMLIQSAGLVSYELKKRVKQALED